MMGWTADGGAAPRIDPTLDAVVERASRAHEAGFDCSVEGAAWRLRLWGPLPPHWAGNLSLHCFAAGIDIQQGDALRLGAGLWAASFVLRGRKPSKRPTGIDFLRMAQRRPTLVPGGCAGAIEGAEVSLDAARGALNVWVRGRDQLGLLAHLLERFAGCGLYPHRMIVRTQAGRIEDWFSLLGVGGGPASPGAAEALRAALVGG
jgi:hypothetical protein